MATVYGGTNDGWCGQGLNSWADARNGAGNSYDSNNSRDQTAVYQFYHSGRGTYQIYRAFFEFDTSGISVAPTSATLKIFGFGYGEGDVIVVKSEHNPTLGAGDFNSLPSAALTALGNTDGNGAGTLAGVSGFTYSAEKTTWSTSGYNSFLLNNDAKDDMASLDLFKVCLMNHDNDYVDQDGTAIERNGTWWADVGGTSRDPYIDYTAAVAADNATFFGTNF